MSAAPTGFDPAAATEAYLSRLHDFVRAMDEDLHRQRADASKGAIPER